MRVIKLTQFATAAAITMLALIGASPAQSAQTDLGRFAGAYVGETITQGGETMELGDLHLRLKVRGDGFVADWRSLADPDESEEHHHNVTFVLSHRDNIYVAVLGCDMFGNRVPLDPMRGGPFMWASIEEARMNLYVMKIGARGTHDLRIYRYRLEGEKLALSFERHRDEKRVQVVLGSMFKQTGATDSMGAMSGNHVKDHKLRKCG